MNSPGQVVHWRAEEFMDDNDGDGQSDNEESIDRGEPVEVDNPARNGPWSPRRGGGSRQERCRLRRDGVGRGSGFGVHSEHRRYL